jgi:hypothetical protein
MSVQFSTITARVLIFLLIFGIAQPIGKSHGKAKAHSAAATRQHHSKNVNHRLTAIESSLHTLQNEPRITDEQANYLKQLYENKLDIDKLNNVLTQVDTRLSNNKLETYKLINNIKEEEAKVGAAELTLSGQYFSIFATIVGLVALFSGIAGYIVQNGITPVVLRKAKKAIKEQISTFMKNESLITVSEISLQVAYVWWEHYEPDYQKILRGQTISWPDMFRRYLMMAKTQTNKGLSIINPEVI